MIVFTHLTDQTDELLAQVNMTKSEGAVGVYDDQFTAMEMKLEEVKMIIDGFNQSKTDMSDISSAIEEIRY
jgi:hypothetical protein